MTVIFFDKKQMGEQSLSLTRNQSFLDTSLKVILAPLLVFWLILPITALADDESEIRESFSQLQLALQNKDSNTALQLLSQDTKEYYALLSKVASSSSPEELDKLSPLNRIMVITVRQKVPKAKWRGKDPSALLKAAIDGGLVSKSLSTDIKLGEITVDGERAYSAVAIPDKSSNLKMVFFKEDGGWKVSLASLIDQVNAMTEEFMAKVGVDSDAFSKKLAERVGTAK